MKNNLATNHYHKLLWTSESFEESTISNFESQSNFQVKENKILKLFKKQ